MRPAGKLVQLIGVEVILGHVTDPDEILPALLVQMHDRADIARHRCTGDPYRAANFELNSSGKNIR